MVSVIIPVYNGEEYLEKSLLSVMQQSYGDLQIIVIDDGSTDRSYEICERLAQNDKRLYLMSQKNAGVSAARNKGLMVASGEYVMFVDSDDILPQKATEHLIKGAKEGTDLVVGSYKEFRGRIGKTVYRETAQYSREVIKYELPRYDHLIGTPWAKLYKRETIAKNSIWFDERLPFNEDHVFNLNFCKNSSHISVISDVVYCYRMGGMASSVKYHPNMNELYMAWINAYCDFYDGMENVPKSFLKQIIKDQLMGSIRHYVLHCPYRTAVTKTDETLRMYAALLTEDTVDCDNYSPAMVRTVLDADARGFLKLVYRKYWLRLILRKLKRVYYSVFSRRI